MAGNIQNVNIAQLRAKCEEYKDKVAWIQSSMSEVEMGMQSIKMHWTGKRMNAVLEKYNSLSKNFITAINFFNKTVGNTLEEIVAQYESMENKGVAENLTITNKSTLETVIYQLELTSTENVKFEQERVQAETIRIIGNLDQLGVRLDEAVGILDEIKPASDSLQKLVTSYNAESATVISNLKEIKETLRAEVDNAVKVVQTTESYNDSDAGRVQGGQA